MASSFRELKRRSASGELFAQIRSLANDIPYILGTQKRTRLKRAGCANSKTLLHDDVAARHAKLLLADYQRLTRRKDYNSLRLRYLTLLYSVCEMNVDHVVSQCKEMSASILHDFRRSRVSWALGATEVELINFDLLKRINGRSGDKKRKFHVLCDLAPTGFHSNGMVDSMSATSGTKVLVHCHLLVDLGDNADEIEEDLRKRLSRFSVPYQVEIKMLFHTTSLYKNLLSIASYNTKCGNEELRFKAGFGRDLPEDIEAKMWRAGIGRKDRGNYEDRAVEDERGLTPQHVAFLDNVYDRLMRLRRDKRGYLIRFKNKQ
jgi:hypothetical protein